MKKTVMFLFTCVILTGCYRSPVVDIRAEAKAINAIEGQWDAAIIRKDVDKIISFFAPGAVVMNQNAPSFIGLEAIRKSLESWFADTTNHHNTFTSAIDTIEFSASGDLAYARGTNRIKMSTSNGIVEDLDKWITIYRKINGEWKVIVDIWNSDIPISGK